VRIELYVFQSIQLPNPVFNVVNMVNLKCLSFRLQRDENIDAMYPSAAKIQCHIVGSFFLLYSAFPPRSANSGFDRERLIRTTFTTGRLASTQSVLSNYSNTTRESIVFCGYCLLRNSVPFSSARDQRPGGHDCEIAPRSSDPRTVIMSGMDKWVQFLVSHGAPDGG